MVIPSLSRCLGMARPFRIGATGGPDLLVAEPDQSPQLGDGTCRVSMCNWRVSVDDILQMSLDSKSGRTHQYSRNYLGPAPQAVDPQSIVTVRGQSP